MPRTPPHWAVSHNGGQCGRVAPEKARAIGYASGGVYAFELSSCIALLQVPETPTASTMIVRSEAGTDAAFSFLSQERFRADSCAKSASVGSRLPSGRVRLGGKYGSMASRRIASSSPARRVGVECRNRACIGSTPSEAPGALRSIRLGSGQIAPCSSEARGLFSRAALSSLSLRA
jgi:hypothetical protein